MQFSDMIRASTHKPKARQEMVRFNWVHLFNLQNKQIALITLVWERRFSGIGGIAEMAEFFCLG